MLIEMRSALILAAAAAVAAPARPAAAGPDPAIARLRRALAERDTPARRCELGILYAGAGDLPRAHIYLRACDEAHDEALAKRAAPSRTRVKKALAASDLSPIEVVTRPEGLRVEIDALPGDSFVAPAQIWLPAGTYRLRATAVGGYKVATAQLKVADGRRALVTLESPRPAPRARAGKVDFSDEAATDVHAGPPPKVEHPSLLPAKYRKGLRRP